MTIWKPLLTDVFEEDIDNAIDLNLEQEGPGGLSQGRPTRVDTEKGADRRHTMEAGVSGLGSEAQT